MEIALVSDFLIKKRGAEKVFKIFTEIFPNAEIFTLFYDPKVFNFDNRKINTSYLQKIPNIKRTYKNFIFLYPAAIETLDLKKFDLVISTSAICAHGVLTHPNSIHISYIHTPLRYIWYLYPELLQERAKEGFIKRIIGSCISSYLRNWDFCAAQRLGYIIANSNNTKKKIKNYYKLASEVIYPPLDIEKIEVSQECEDYFLYVGELLPYKGIRFLLSSFKQIKKNIIVVGSGPELISLRREFGGVSNIHLLGWQDDKVVEHYYKKCKAVIIPGEEDFCLVSVEAQAHGKPVLAYNKGGNCETVIDGKSGLFFNNYDIEEFLEKLDEIEHRKFDPFEIRESSFRFDKSVFIYKWSQLLRGIYGIDLIDKYE
jgi:glycosyltransferase involved in cell wall biosynthesis